MDIVVLISYLSLGVTVVSTAAFVYFNKRDYIAYDPKLFNIIGLVYSRSLTNTAVISVLMWYFTFYEGDLVVSAVLSNIQDSLSSLLVICMANISDVVFGKFRTLVFSNTAYIGGLLLLYIFNPYDVKWLIVIALVLLSLGTSGDNLLEESLSVLLKDIDKSKEREQEDRRREVTEPEDREREDRKRKDKEQEDRERTEARTTFWSRLANVSGAISATLWVAPSATGGIHQSWRSTFLICIIFMIATLINFVRGYSNYRPDEFTKRPITMFFHVCRECIQKLCKSDTRHLTITSDSEDWVKVKSLVKLFPIWASFFVVALISATGSTFFIEQYSNLNTKRIPVQIYSLIQQGSSFGIPLLYRWASGSHKNENIKIGNEKIKIGVAMLCSIICCVFAWQLEVHRLKKVGNLQDQDASTSISFLWLVPQFFVLGCMEGLSKDGLLKFFKSQVNNKDLESYGEEYIEVVMGVGKLFTIALILIFKNRLGWFSETINDSRLDKYYRILVYVCSANFAIYCFIVKCWFKGTTNNQELATVDSQRRPEP